MSGGRVHIGGDVPAFVPAAWRARLADLAALTKPRPMSIVLLAALAGLLADAPTMVFATPSDAKGLAI